MIRLRELISRNLRELISLPRNAYMERESLLISRRGLLKVKSIIDELQIIIDLRSN